MYEFFAPWGVIAPAVTALITYYAMSNARWRKQRETLEQASLIGQGFSAGPESARIVI